MIKIENWLTKRCLISGNKLALVANEGRWTFNELQELVLKQAAKLENNGIKPRNRVALLSFNSLDLYLSILALQQLNCQLVLLNPRLSQGELAFQLSDSQVDYLIGEADLITPLAFPKKFSFKQIKQTTSHNKIQAVTDFPMEQVTSIMYTSGTSGTPKGVLQTFANHWWSANASLLNLGLRATDSWILTVPLFHISGLSMMMKSLIYGVPIYLFNQFKPREINELLISGAGTNISVVSTMLKALLTDLGDKNYHPDLACVLLGGGPIEESLLELCLTKKIPVIQSYGMTETASQVVALNQQDAKEKLGSAGLPLFPTKLRISQDDHSIAPPETIGEIQLQGPTITPNYLNRTEAYEQTWTDDGWFKTGDLGYCDQAGFLYLKSRLNELIISGGENIYPHEVESSLTQFPIISEAAVIAREDPRWGQVPIAFVVLESGCALNEQELKEFLREQLAHYKIPHEIIQLDYLPRNASGKVLKRELKKRS